MLQRILKELYHFNYQDKVCAIKDYAPDTHSTPTPNHIMTMSGVMVVLDTYCKLLIPLPFSACCALMKFSRSRHRILRFSLRHLSISLTLLFHKTSQFGGKWPYFVQGLHSTIVLDIKSFVLYMLSKEEAYLYPVYILEDWLAASKIN